MLVVLALWAGLHLLPNGDLAHVIVFGIFAAFAVLGRTLINRRKKREMTQARWQALKAQTMAAPLFLARTNPRWVAVRVLAAVFVYLSLLLFHSIVLRVPVISL